MNWKEKRRLMWNATAVSVRLLPMGLLIIVIWILTPTVKGVSWLFHWLNDHLMTQRPRPREERTVPREDIWKKVDEELNRREPSPQRPSSNWPYHNKRDNTRVYRDYEDD